MDGWCFTCSRIPTQGEKRERDLREQSVLSRQLDDLEPTLTRHGYRVKDLVEQFDAKPAEIKAPFSNALEPVRAATLRDRMLAAGLPI
ncbi:MULTISPECIES: phosphoribulokinase [Paraburkholderia]|uniref:phosphoribulokinase n=1 Tax=Paraburkholderia TaxID=1822464 RepID=UPI00321883EB